MRYDDGAWPLIAGKKQSVRADAGAIVCMMMGHVGESGRLAAVGFII